MTSTRLKMRAWVVIGGYEHDNPGAAHPVGDEWVEVIVRYKLGEWDIAELLPVIEEEMRLSALEAARDAGAKAAVAAVRNRLPYADDSEADRHAPLRIVSGGLDPMEASGWNGALELDAAQRQ